MRWSEIKNGFFFPLIFHHCFFWGANILFFYLWKRILGFEMLRPDFKTNSVWWQIFSLGVQCLWRCDQASLFPDFSLRSWVYMTVRLTSEGAGELPSEFLLKSFLPLSSYPQERQDLCVKSSQCLRSWWETQRKNYRRFTVLFLLNSCDIVFLLFPISWIQNNQDSLRLSSWRETANTDA